MINHLNIFNIIITNGYLFKASNDKYIQMEKKHHLVYIHEFIS